MSVLSLEAMAADCKARGCSLERQIVTDREGRYANFYHRPSLDYWQDNPDDPTHISRVSAWRQRIHDGIDPYPQSVDGDTLQVGYAVPAMKGSR